MQEPHAQDELRQIIRLVRTNDELADELRRALLSDELLKLPERFAEFTTSAIRTFGAFYRDLADLRHDLGLVREELGVLRHDLRAVQEDLGALKASVTALAGESSDLHSEFGKFAERRGRSAKMGGRSLGNSVAREGVSPSG